jgi:type IX secretion system PorP/SprF family membrane protein
MKLTKTLLRLLAALVCFAGGLRAQDLHNTLFYMNPLHMNPAFTGAYEGTYRIGGIYRDQARTVVTNAYSTPSIFIDAPILMVGKRHWVGVGGLMFQDAAGDGKLTTSALQLSGAFHLALDKKSKNILTLGVQWGKVQRKIKSLEDLLAGDYLQQVQDEVANPKTTDSVLGGGSTSPGQGGQDPEKAYTDINAGVMLKSVVNKNTDYHIGVSTRHITSPDYAFGSSNVDLPIRFIVHGQLNTNLNKKWTINPEVYFSNIKPASQLQLHGWAGYKLKPDIKLNGGLGYRIGDSAQLLLGIDYKDIKAALGYDITLSSLGKVNSRQGGFEIAVYYIGKIFKKPDVKPTLLCPNL